MLDEKFSAVLDQKEIPYIPECDAYVEEFYITAAAQRNRNHVGKDVEFKDCSFSMEEILFDPQTSGGLLVSMEASDAEKAIVEIRNLGLPCGIIGEIVEKNEKKIYVY
jgi:selenide,water dikinase